AEHLAEAMALFADLPDSAAAAAASGELARLHMIEYRTDEAVVAARASYQLADRLGLADHAASARITEAMARYLGGDPKAYADMEAALQTCREQKLPSLRRAAHNLSVIATAEGQLARAIELQEEREAADGGRLHQVLSHSEEAVRAYFTGDWTTLLQAAEAYLDVDGAETTDWDLQLRGQRAWIRLLCGEPPGEEVTHWVDSAERSGFARLRLIAYAHGAFCRLLEGESSAAVQLVDLLASEWPLVRNTSVEEWLPVAGHASALLAEQVGIAPAEAIVQVAASVPLRTPWAVATEQVALGACVLARDEPAAAAGQFAEAVRGYDAIGAVSDAVLTAVWAARAYRAAGDDAAAAPYLDRVRAFAVRYGATRLAEMVA
ncbi:MAG: hypothetical protein ACRDT4_19580, partial [Micromonosporaceae bacterium]